jgi:hypothetical protein
MGDLNERFDHVDDLDIKLITRRPRYCAQYLHVGNYNLIDNTKQDMLEELYSKGCKSIGELEEIYMNHPHCNPPEKLKILLRQEIQILT